MQKFVTGKSEMMEPFCEQSEQNVSRAGLSDGQWERVIFMFNL